MKPFAGIPSEMPSLFFISNSPQNLPICAYLCLQEALEYVYLILEAVLAFLHKKDASKGCRNSLSSSVMFGLASQAKNMLIWWN